MLLTPVKVEEKGLGNPGKNSTKTEVKHAFAGHSGGGA
jgi:hypothetical protein